eukprot:TRINITY_DN93153_c0_g1_i1.p1 TRINITY_DN93153_c0_g1~~TRINITY_DN93153_c0_g1_i1.p1  ORF type:complete len:367 (-),score=80.80 TRINITY_DN93153_c0_g1_i1:3-1103(-)
MPVPDKIYPAYCAKIPPLTGKVIAITGTTTGTGFWTAKAAVRAGATCVIMLNRSSARSKEAENLVKESIQQGSNTSVITVNCDLQSFESVREAAREVSSIATKHGGLDCLVNNAGIMAVPDRRSDDGFDVQMQTNHLSHFLLTKLLMPSLEEAANSRGEARVVQHSSGARSGERQAPDKANLTARYFEKSEPGALGGDSLGECFARYHQSKLANSVFMVCLHRKLTAKGSKVKSVCAEPGVCDTALLVNLQASHKAAGKGLCIMNCLLGCLRCCGMKPQSGADGACSLMMAAFSPDANSGDFYMPGDGRSMAGGDPVKCMEAGKATPKNPTQAKKFQDEKLSLDEANQALLWTKSEEAVQEQFKLD